MSRWTVEFNSHPFWQAWEVLQGKVTGLIVDDQTVTAAVEELARLKKVIDYLSGVIEAVDPDLTPRSVWDNVNAQLSPCLIEVSNYESTRQIVHLVNANGNVDNLLTYVRPYMVLPDKVMSASRTASENLAEAIEARTRRFEELAAQGLVQITNQISDARNAHATLMTMLGQANEFQISVFGQPGNEASGLKGRLETLRLEAENRSEAIKSVFERVVKQHDGDSTLESGLLQLELKAAAIVAQVESAQKLLTARLVELRQYYDQVFGRPEGEDEPAAIGLKAEIDNRLESLDKLKIEQDSKFNALFSKVEGLLPGATSAGLASAYKDMRDSFAGRITTYTRLFYGSLGGLFVAGLFAVIQEVQLWPLKFVLVETPDWQGMLRLILYKAPLFLPVIWLAIFSATRRSQYERLHQEYAHKESFAKSYESYKVQLEQLGQATEDLRSKLIEKMIDTVSFNASETLDKNHREKSPVEGVLEKLSLDDIRKLAEMAKDKK